MEKLKITYYGHSTFMVESADVKVLFDPFISGNPSLTKDFNLDEIHPDYILVTHAHDDHIGDLLSIAEASKAMVIGTWEMHVWLNKKGITNTHPMNIGGTRLFDNLQVHMFQAMHTSSFSDGSDGGSAVGFVIEMGAYRFYYAGDTGLFSDMKLIPELMPVDFAFLPIGGNFTMNATYAVKAAKFIQCDQIIAMHFDTFGYIVIDHQSVKDEFKQAGIHLLIPEHGYSYQLPLK